MHLDPTKMWHAATSAWSQTRESDGGGRVQRVHQSGLLVSSVILIICHAAILISQNFYNHHKSVVKSGGILLKWRPNE
jgi:hypothetical protein